ncbi:hypothetical protein CRYUN_Cryun27aG0021500 [Craigia yunnanensis]
MMASATLSRWLMGSFLIFLPATTFTDSFRTATGRLYYGIATFRGIWTFNVGRKKPCLPADYKLRWNSKEGHQHCSSCGWLSCKCFACGVSFPGEWELGIHSCCRGKQGTLNFETYFDFFMNK